MADAGAPADAPRRVTAAGGAAAGAVFAAPAAALTREEHAMRDGESGDGGAFDAVVIGGNWAGLSAATYLARARRRVLVLDAGRPRNRFASHSHGFLTRDGVPVAEATRLGREQLLKYPSARFEPHAATAVAAEGGTFRVTFGERGRAVTARRLVLATGVVDQLPGVPGLAERWGDGVNQCPYCHGYEVAGRRLAVLWSPEMGGMSVHQAMLLRDWSDTVTLLTNGPAELSDEDRRRLRARGVSVAEDRVVALHGAGTSVEAVEFAGGVRRPFDAAFVAVPYRLAGTLHERLGCQVVPGRAGPVIKTDEQKQTTVPGVYAAGDIARVTHSAVFAAADGAAAGIAAHQSTVFADDLHGQR